MVGSYFARRRPLSANASPETVVSFYRTYKICRGDSIGQFLREYLKLWRDAHRHGVTGDEGIDRLVNLMPPELEDWARDIARNFIREEEGPPRGFVGDLPGCVEMLIHQYERIRAPPHVPSPPHSPPPKTPSPPPSPVHLNNPFGRRRCLEKEANGTMRLGWRTEDEHASSSRAHDQPLPRDGDRGKAPIQVDSDEEENPGEEWRKLFEYNKRLDLEYELSRERSAQRTREFERKMEERLRENEKRRARYRAWMAELDHRIERLREPLSPNEPPQDPQLEEGGQEEGDPEEEDPDEEEFMVINIGDDEEDPEEAPEEPDFEEGNGMVIDEDPDSEEEDPEEDLEGGEFQNALEYDSDHSTICSE